MIFQRGALWAYHLLRSHERRAGRTPAIGEVPVNQIDRVLHILPRLCGSCLILRDSRYLTVCSLMFFNRMASSRALNIGPRQTSQMVSTPLRRALRHVQSVFAIINSRLTSFFADGVLLTAHDVGLQLEAVPRPDCAAVGLLPCALG